jgi:cytochrome b561
MRSLRAFATRIQAALIALSSSCAARFTTTVPFRNTSLAWGTMSQLLHWLVVFLIVVQWALAKYAATQTLAGKIGPLGLHKSIGITIFALALLRLIWRLSNTVPAESEELKAWERILARISHILLYAFIIALPITGWLMSSARNFPVSWFGEFQLPALVSPDHRLFEQMDNLHQAFFTALLAVALLHVLGALKHHFVDRNDILLRMLPVWRAGARAARAGRHRP